MRNIFLILWDVLQYLSSLRYPLAACGESTVHCWHGFGVQMHVLDANGTTCTETCVTVLYEEQKENGAVCGSCPAVTTSNPTPEPVALVMTPQKNITTAEGDNNTEAAFQPTFNPVSSPSALPTIRAEAPSGNTTLRDTSIPTSSPLQAEPSTSSPIQQSPLFVPTAVPSFSNTSKTEQSTQPHGAPAISTANNKTTAPFNSSTPPTPQPFKAPIASPPTARPTEDAIALPYKGRTSTPLDPYVIEDCYYGDNIQPHVISQCECFQSIDIIADDIMELYRDIRADISEVFYGGSYSEEVTSCNPINQALYWLSSGNTRDAGDLYQRFTLAFMFISMNGTSWDQKQLWLSYETECLWYGVQCNRDFQVNNIAVDANNVHGSIPTEISSLEHLKVLSMTRNHLSGEIPESIITMPELEYLMLYTNELIGSIPTAIGKASNLRSLRVENNFLFGTLATEIGQATALEELSLGFNEFWRVIPTELGLLTNMKELVLEENRFSGTMPTELGKLSELEYFLISKNLMRGPIPTELQSMTDLTEFRLEGAGIEGEFPKELAVWTHLNRLEMGSNDFKGTIMTEFGLMTSLNRLSANGNEFTGTIPTELGNLVNMTRLMFKDCLLTGTIPTELGRMAQLERLELHDNLLTGKAPLEVCSLTERGLNQFTTDCIIDDRGVDCACCTFCNRA